MSERRTLTQNVTGAGAALTVVLAIAAPLVARWEGGRQRDGSAIAYADRLANGLPTACEGITNRDHLGRPIVVGRRYTAQECNAMLDFALRAHLVRIRPCIPDMNATLTGAALSLAYNIGPTAFCRSTVSARFRAGNYAEACRGFMAWNKARRRGRLIVVPGLVNRRNAEIRLCLQGV